MDQNERERRLSQIREQISQLDAIETLSDEELDSVAGGEEEGPGTCSIWCCSGGGVPPPLDENTGG